jgi:broad specificity phosphatase PhoE
VPTLHFIRHGETEWNRNGLIQGFSDVPLSDVGREQARALAAELASRPIGALFAADLRRTVETATPIADALALEIRTTPALRERDFGANEGRVADEVAVERGTARGSGWTSVDERHPGGESIRELYRRVADFLDALVADAPADEIAIVTSGGPICVAAAHLAREPVDTIAWRAFSNCSLTTVDVAAT